MSAPSLWWASREKCCLIKLLAATRHVTSNQTESCEILFHSVSGPDFSFRTRDPTMNCLCSFHLYWHFFQMSIEHNKTNRNLENLTFSRSRLRSAVHNAWFVSFLKPLASLGQASFFRLQSCLSYFFCRSVPYSPLKSAFYYKSLSTIKYGAVSAKCLQYHRSKVCNYLANIDFVLYCYHYFHNEVYLSPDWVSIAMLANPSLHCIKDVLWQIIRFNRYYYYCSISIAARLVLHPQTSQSRVDKRHTTH